MEIRDKSNRVKFSDPNLAELAGSNLSGRDLAKARLDHCDLAEADFAGANLFAADMSYCDLRGANFEGACLRLVNLFRSDLRGAVLDGAVLDGACLKDSLLDPHQCAALVDLLGIRRG